MDICGWGGGKFGKGVHAGDCGDWALGENLVGGGGGSGRRECENPRNQMISFHGLRECDFFTLGHWNTKIGKGSGGGGGNGVPNLRSGT